MNPHRKKVLIITYYFPPSGGAGVQRTLKFVKYLRESGWEPVVLTVRDADYPAYDASLFSEVPEGVKVYRSRIIEPYRLYRKFTGRKANESTDVATLTLGSEGKRKITERISEWIRSVFFIPDARVGWLNYAVRMGKEIIQNEKIDVLFSSAPPYTAHLIGLKLCRESQLPWVADFRDSWIGWLSTPQWRPKLSRWIENRMENAVLKNANKIVSVSKGVKFDLLSRHPEQQDERWYLLPNGYDAADFDCIQPLMTIDKLTITYVGSLYGPRNPEYLLQALETWQKQDSALLNKLFFRIIGRIGEPILQRINSSTVSKIFEIMPYMSHQKCLSYLLGSDISLLIIDDAPANSGILTGKLFEYIGVGNPILALAPEGEAAALIRTNKLGWVVPPNDVNAIQSILQLILERNKQSDEKYQINPALRTRFERRTQTRELAEILDGLLM